MTIADEVAQVWPEIKSHDPNTFPTVESLKVWFKTWVEDGEEESVKDMEQAITILDQYDDDANPFTTMAE